MLSLICGILKRKEKERKKKHLKQEIDGPQARDLQLVSCLHFLGQEKGGLQAGHLQLASCLHFLKQELGMLQEHMQPTYYLLSEMEVRAETG